MKIVESSFKDLHETGVYKITNLINGKVYVGSTRKSFVSRYTSHFEKLRTDNHKAYPHLQNAANKYGINNFEFEILEICDKEQCIDKETEWIAKLEACDRNKGYNMNDRPFLSPFANKEIRAKAAATFKERWKSGQIGLNAGNFKKGILPWNTGKTYLSTEHLKVPKKKKADKTNFIQTVKDKQVPIQVFNSKGIKLNEYRYYQDIQNDKSLEKSMILKNKIGRNGYSPYYLATFNIQKSCKTGKSYKGLYFKYTNSPQ